MSKDTGKTKLTRRSVVQGGSALLATGVALSPLVSSSSHFAWAGSLRSDSFGKKVGLSAEDRNHLLDASQVPQYGNSSASVVIAEFSDFRCPHCRSTTSSLNRAVKEDGNVLWTFPVFPILGADSTELARLGLAAHAQGRYADWHFAVMTWPGRVRVAKAPEIADTLGLDLNALRARIREEGDYEATLRRNALMARGFRISGTPTFIVFNRQALPDKDNLFPAMKVSGERSSDEFKVIFQRARKTT